MDFKYRNHQVRKNILCKAISMSVFSSVFLGLTACGGGDATDRKVLPDVNTDRTTYNLIIHSPVKIKNAKVTLKDIKTGVEVAAAQQFNTTGGNDLIFAVPIKYTDNHILLAEMTPIDSSATYYDPTLDQFAPLNKPIHALSLMTNSDVSGRIDPYTEITYQRAVVRSGSNDVTKPTIANITSTILNIAGLETLETFRVSANLNTVFVTNSIADFASLDFSSTSNSYLAFYDEVMGIGHIQLQHTQNPSDTTPYLTFMERAALDMRDGDLDGITIHGYGANGGAVIANPIITATENNDPALNNTKALKGQSARLTYSNLHRDATRAFFNHVNAVKPMQPAAYTEIQTKFDYLDGSYRTTAQNLHSIGAGNYTNAYGLTISQQPVKSAVTADDLSSSSVLSDVAQIVGTYTGSGCSLDIANTGIVTLTQGNTVKSALINQEDSDTLTLSGTNNYILNVSNPKFSPIEYIQIRSIGHELKSAVFGTSSNKNADALDNVTLSCSF